MSRSKRVPVELRVASAEIIASLTKAEDISSEHIITDVFDPNLVTKLSSGIVDVVEALRLEGYDL